MSLFIVPDGINAPSKAHPGDAGYDIESREDKWLNPGEAAEFSTGVRVNLPEGWRGDIRPRSGLARDYRIDVLAGVIDQGYTGEIIVLLINHGKVAFHARKGQRIAQIVFTENAVYTEPERHPLPGHEQTMRDLGNLSIRGSAGFGSSGR
ncbi:dUTP diphosphatase [Pseudoclavibacter helvolus]|uniref:dUTP diphosphatase n=1 Tax=Pseudoclavibacter helvolus TaxID=255205 RepID=UPI003C74DEF1